ncbi:MAG TPA: DNA polymerase III subunit epsilon [Caulobacteraceae bacterium]|jgi:DNA polymerase-3 subunit epsilon|nr:DNA polymerase III subunit epsilon [Caulobacteraceae bacterium]
MSREIILDTETTGLDPQSGHRLIEIGCIEIEDLLPTGRSFHKVVDPERLIDPDAIRVHGITDAMVRGQPKFDAVCDELVAFIGDAPIVAHNAGFDRGFVNFELQRCGRAPIHDSKWIDTLALAQKRFPGMHNSLDALCKRFKISLAEREKHGALIDSRLLAAVYLELRGGKERALDLGQVSARVTGDEVVVESVTYGARPRPLAQRSTPEERARHAAFIAQVLGEKSLWNEVLSEDVAEAQSA